MCAPSLVLRVVVWLAGLRTVQMKGDKDRIEFNELAKDVFPRWLYILTMIILIANFQATNISSIVVSAQTMDNTLLGASLSALSAGGVAGCRLSCQWRP